MVLSNIRLREFSHSVPTCPQTVDLALALDVFSQTGCDRIILLDEGQRPIGWLSAPQLLRQVLTTNLAGPLSGALTPSGAGVPLAPSLIAPLTTLPGDLPVAQFLPYLQTQSQGCFALTGPDQAFLGVLDNARLLQYLAAQLVQLPHSAQPPAATLKNDPMNTAQLAQPLLELLEQLPLPLMLQTYDGQPIAQNSIWQTEVGELVDPAWLLETVVGLLQEPSAATVKVPDHTLSPPAALEPFSAQALQAIKHLQAQSPTSVWATMSADEDASSLSGSLCHLGPKPGMCICVCPLKNGQERVLQFVRIPLGLPSPQAGVALGDRMDAVFAENAQTVPITAQHAPLQPVRNNSPAEPTNFDTIRNEAILFAEKAYANTAQISAAATTGTSVWLILAQDVTEQQRLARELTAKNADLVQLNRLKDEFLACISHELRTPLTAVLGLSSLLKDQTLGALNQRQVHYAQLIYQSGRHLMAVVNDILDLTRTETGQLELVLEPVDISTVCRRAFEQAQQQRRQESDVESSPAIDPPFALEIEPGLDLLVADEQRLRQMLAHLLSNAIKFTEPAQPIGLKVGRWGGWIAFTVWDTGIGIPTEKQHLIFQKFQQLENPLTRRFEGTGLGLVLTQRLARLHGGEVTFVSKPGEGSRFTILLPPNPPSAQSTGNAADAQTTPFPTVVRANAPNATPPPTIAADIAHASVTAPPSASANSLVLIVEAVPPFIEALSEQLTSLGYQVAIARSGTEAVEKARRLQPCIIFLNPVLPLLSGWDVLTLLKSNHETRQIPVVVTATRVDEEQAHQSQADGLLCRPIPPKALQKCLKRLLIDPQATAPLAPSRVLTVLRLTPGIWSKHHQPIPTADLNRLLHSRLYRVLEADDLDQAELLARVWKPSLVLLDGVLVDPIAYFHQYSQHTGLAALPLVTLDQETTQAANQMPGLLVFPCLSTLEATVADSNEVESSALLQVLQVAAGYTCRRSAVLVVDMATLPHLVETVNASDRANPLASVPQEAEWLQALIQYLNTAGLQGWIGRSEQDVLQQVRAQSMDLLLLCWTDAPAPPSTLHLLTTLAQVEPRPPIWVLDHRTVNQTSSVSAIAELPAILRTIAQKILPAGLPMAELLNQIRHAIKPTER